jgi:hypothetical protein
LKGWHENQPTFSRKAYNLYLSKTNEMNKIRKISVLTLIVVVLFVVSTFFLMNNNRLILTNSEVISLLKTAYPEYKNYPNDNLPPQSIQTKQSSNGWYIAFVQEGSGRPILEAKCYFVSNDKSITFIGEYLPKIGEDRFDLSGVNIFNLWFK